MTFNLTRDQLEATRAKLASDGVDLVGDSGNFTHSGVIIDFSYVEPILSIEVKHKPALIPESLVESKISGWFATEQA